VPPHVEVSLVIPCYNGEPFLAATIESVLAQTFAPLEVIVVDDGSTDASAAIAERFGPPVRLIRQANQGESVARNRGIAEARGTHLLFLDADDLLGPEALSRLATAVDGRPGAVALMGCARFTTNPLTPISIVHPTHAGFWPDIIVSNFGPPHTWMAPADLVRKAGGFCETMRWSEDWDVLWRIGLYATQLVRVDYVGAHYRQHERSQLATTSQSNRARGHAALMSRMVTTLLGHPALLDAHGDQLFWSAWTALRRARERHVPWSELAPLTRALRQLAATAPERVRRTRTARAIRLIGARLVIDSGIALAVGSRPSAG
jgi:hypothetical protein